MKLGRNVVEIFSNDMVHSVQHFTFFRPLMALLAIHLSQTKRHVSNKQKGRYLMQIQSHAPVPSLVLYPVPPLLGAGSLPPVVSVGDHFVFSLGQSIAFRNIRPIPRTWTSIDGCNRVIVHISGPGSYSWIGADVLLRPSLPFSA